MCDEGEYLIPVMEKNLDYCKYLHPPPPSPKRLKAGLILAVFTLKLLLNNELGKNLAKEKYLPRALTHGTKTF